jgi:hypothetical protein
MGSPAYKFRTLRLRDAWLPAVLMGAVIGGSIYIGFAEVGLLVAMSVLAIGVTALAYSDAKKEPRYWLVIAFFCGAHGLILAFSNADWIPKPTIVLMPIAMLDYLAMAWLFPKLSGLTFDHS